MYQKQPSKVPNYSSNSQQQLDKHSMEQMRERLQENTNSMYCPDSQMILASKNPFSFQENQKAATKDK